MTKYEGLVHGLGEQLYHSLPGLSSTGAKQILVSGRHYQDYIQRNAEGAEDPEPANPAYELGSAVHSRVLKVGAQVEVYPKDVLSEAGTIGTNAARAWAKGIRDAGNIPLKAVEFNVIKRMADSVKANDYAMALLEGGTAEVSMFADDPETGVAIRGRLDYLRPNAITDLKTTRRDASESGFAADVYDHGYDVQFGLYEHIYQTITGETAPPWLWVVVENKRPFLTAVHALGEDEKEMGRKKARRAIDRFKQYTDSGIWPGYEHRTKQPIGLIKAPAWAVFQFIDEYEGVAA